VVAYGSTILVYGLQGRRPEGQYLATIELNFEPSGWMDCRYEVKDWEVGKCKEKVKVRNVLGMLVFRQERRNSHFFQNVFSSIKATCILTWSLFNYANCPYKMRSSMHSRIISKYSYSRSLYHHGGRKQMSTSFRAIIKTYRI